MTDTAKKGWMCERCGLRVYVSREDHEQNHKVRPVKPTTREPRPKTRRPTRRRPAQPTEEPTAPIEINERFRAALDAIAAGKPIVLVTGGAGTGKSTFIKALRQEMPAKNIVVLAPTGVAALTAGGQTIHSFCRLPFKPIEVPQDIEAARDPKIVEKIDIVVVDEVSMVRADILDGLECFLRINRNSKAPFGGVQMVLVGDPLQLPPVVRREDEEVLRQRYGTAHFFRAACLKGLSSLPVELNKVYRQKDPHFKELLAHIRTAESAAEAVHAINEAAVGRDLHGPHLILVPTRAAAARENEKQLGALPGKTSSFTAAADGSFTKKTEENLPGHLQLVLKKGAQVMFTKNDPEGRWVNGSLGTVASITKSSVKVLMADGEKYEVQPVTWEDRRYSYDEKDARIVQEVAGTFTQFPLMPAWAVTVHKAQGLTLAQVVVDLDRGAFAPGQVYVALSRCVSLEGLSLRRPLRLHEVRCDPDALEFTRRIRRS